ncbi:MAG: hypothetical protein V4608_15440 [Bacteroidota bacterium]
MITIISLFFTLWSFAQGPAITIKIEKTQWQVTVGPDSILWINKNNQVKIDVKGGDNYYIGLKGGRIKNYKGKYSLIVDTEGAATLTVYEKLPNKKFNPIYTKLYMVKKIPDPVPYVCSVKGDSVIDKLQIINDNEITAIHEFTNTKVPILGFDIIIPIGGQVDTLTSNNSHFTLEMQKRIYYLKSGSVLYFENVYCAMPDGSVQKIKPFEIFVSETNKYKVGYRVIGL